MRSGSRMEEGRRRTGQLWDVAIMASFRYHAMVFTLWPYANLRRTNHPSG